MTNKQIQHLIDTYLAGETTPAEEKKLALKLQPHQDLPEEWQTVSLMLGELTLGEAEYDAIMAQRHQKPTPLIIALRTVSAIAAAWLIGLFLYQQIALSEPSSHSNEVPHYYTSHLSYGSTLKDVYTSRQTKHQLNTYNQLRKMIYENK